MKLKDYFEVSTDLPRSNNGSISLKEKLHQVKKIFDDADIPFFLIFGTALGAVREQNIIPHDDDIDLGFYLEDTPRIGALKSQFEEQGFYIEEVCPANIRIILKDCDGILDLWIIKDVTNLFYKLLGKKWWVDHALLKHDYFNRDILNIGTCAGAELRLPADEITYVKELYGASWRIPQKDVYARYRAAFSQLLHKLFIDSDVPIKYSGDERNNTFKPWVSKILKRFFSNASVTSQFKHPE
jgi:hypothetical protein